MIVRIKNYQKVEKACLEFNGFSVITGETGRGKSCTIRAIRAALLGISHESHISHGKSAAAVEVDFGDHKILWERSPSTQVTVDGILHTRLGKDYGSAVYDTIGIQSIDVSTDTLFPQIGTQFDSMFLVFENPAVVAKAFQVLSHVDTINAASKRAKSDLRLVRGLLKTRHKDLEKVVNKLSKFEVVAGYQNIEPLQGELNKLKQQQLDDEVIREKLSRLIILGNIPEEFTQLEIPDPPDIDDAVSKIKKLERIERLRVLPDPEFSFDIPEETVDTKPLEALYELKHLNRRLGLGIAAVEQHAQKEKSADEQITKAKGILKICPTCQNPFDSQCH